MFAYVILGRTIGSRLQTDAAGDISTSVMYAGAGCKNV